MVDVDKSTAEYTNMDDEDVKKEMFDVIVSVLLSSTFCRPALDQVEMKPCRGAYQDGEGAHEN